MLKNKKNFILITSAVCVVVMIGILAGVISLTNNPDEKTAYREAVVEYGELTVGLTETGNVAVGTANQLFELDLSAFTGGESSDFSWGQGGGNVFQGMGGGMTGGTASSGTSAGNASSSSSGRALEIEEILVSEGQEIEIGTPLYNLSQESVDSIRQELELDVTDAEVVLAQNQTQQQMTKLQAEQTKQLAVTYGSLADTEYNSRMVSLQNAVDEINEQIVDLTEETTELNEALIEYQTLLAEQKTVLENAEYVVSASDIASDTYGWITAENAREDAESLVENLEKSIETVQDNIETNMKQLETLQNSLIDAQRDMEIGTIDAQAQLELRRLQYQNADEQYQVSVEKSDFDVQVAQEEYEQAIAKLEEFNSALDGRTILASYRGVITEISLSEGDSVNTGTTLLVLNDYDEVTASVTVEESDLANISEGDTVNVFIASWPDEEFTGAVDEIGDSVYNSSTGTSYAEITVKIGGPTEKLYEGMTAEVTFITKETEEVLFVSNRAVYRENGKSYVKKKATDGTAEAAEVVTGFSDGINVEILSGLAEGEMVLIESKVSD